MTDYYSEVGGDATVIRDFESTGRMQIEFSRAPESFAVNRYAELRPVTLAEGYYLRIDPAQGGRILYNDDREHIWLDMADRPTGTDNQLQFIMATYKTLRRAYSVPLSDRAVSMTAWPVAETEMRQKAQQAMTARTIRAVQSLNSVFSVAPASTNNSISVASIPNVTGSGKWSLGGTGGTAAPNIQICLQYALNIILQGTTGVIDPSDLVLVINPHDAMLMSQSAEIKQMLSSSVYAYPQITGQMPGFPAGRQMNYGLPPMLYDFRIAVEKTVQVTSPKNNTGTVPAYTYAVPNGTAYLLARKDNAQVNPAYLKAESEGRKISDEEGRKIPVYSTLTGFFKEEFTTEIFAEPKHRRTTVSIVTDFDYQVTSYLSGFQFTSIT